MKTNEVCDILNMTKKTIYYYEECGLILPNRDENGYRDFTKRDIQCLRFIQILRNMNVSIEDIKGILNGKISLIDCLEEQKAKINDQIDNLLNIAVDIEDLLERKPIYFLYKEVKNSEKVKNIFFYGQENVKYEKEDYLLFTDHEIIYNHKNEIESLSYQSIKSIKISMCSRLQNTGKTILRFGQPLYTFGNGNVSPYVFYYLDLDIYINNRFYKFESRSLNDIDKIICLLYDKVQNIDDPIGLYDFFLKYPTKEEQYNKINIHFKEWAKKYHLDNPRKLKDNQFQDYIKQFKSH